MEWSLNLKQTLNKIWNWYESLNKVLIFGEIVFEHNLNMSLWSEQTVNTIWILVSKFDQFMNNIWISIELKQSVNKDWTEYEQIMNFVQSPHSPGAPKSHQSSLIDLCARLQKNPRALCVPRLGGNEQRAGTVLPWRGDQDACIPSKWLSIHPNRYHILYKIFFYKYQTYLSSS